MVSSCILKKITILRNIIQSNPKFKAAPTTICKQHGGIAEGRIFGAVKNIMFLGSIINVGVKTTDIANKK